MVREQRSAVERSSGPAMLHRSPASQAAAQDVERALSLLSPFIEATITDREISHDQALVIVVVDPHAPASDAFEDAILVMRAFGRAAACDVDYARYAVDKARAAHRERCDTSILRERGAALLTDLPLVGGLHRHGWTLGVSGAIPAFDEAIGAIVIDLLVALGSQRAARSGVDAAVKARHDA